MSNPGRDGRARLGGWAYKKAAKEKSGKEEKVLTRISKIDTYFTKSNVSQENVNVQSGLPAKSKDTLDLSTVNVSHENVILDSTSAVTSGKNILFREMLEMQLYYT